MADKGERPNGPWRRAPARPAPVLLAILSACALATTSSPGMAKDSGSVRLAQAPAPKITVAPTIQAEVASQAALAIEVGPRSALPSNSFLRLRGLPPSVSLTEGYAIAAGIWAVPLIGLPQLKANVPAGVSGRAEIVISLVGVDGNLLAEARTTFIVMPGAATTAQKGATAPPPAPVPAERLERSTSATTPRAPDLSPQERARAEKLLSQGERYLDQGNIALAREFFRRAADMGFAQGAIRLAATYDPAELARLHTQGVVPNRAEARKWYERAKELGAPEAESRLARLGDS